MKLPPLRRGDVVPYGRQGGFWWDAAYRRQASPLALRSSGTAAALSAAPNKTTPFLLERGLQSLLIFYSINHLFDFQKFSLIGRINKYVHTHDTERQSENRLGAVILLI